MHADGGQSNGKNKNVFLTHPGLTKGIFGVLTAGIFICFGIVYLVILLIRMVGEAFESMR